MTLKLVYLSFKHERSGAFKIVTCLLKSFDLKKQRGKFEDLWFRFY